MTAEVLAELVSLLWALVEHSEVLTQGHKGRQLVGHPDAERACRALRHRRDRGVVLRSEPKSARSMGREFSQSREIAALFKLTHYRPGSW
jgi:hypothetical protein